VFNNSLKLRQSIIIIKQHSKTKPFLVATSAENILKVLYVAVISWEGWSYEAISCALMDEK